MNTLEIVDGRKIYLTRPTVFRISEQIFGKFSGSPDLNIQNEVSDLIYFTDANQKTIPFSPEIVYRKRTLSIHTLLEPDPNKTNYLYIFNADEIRNGKEKPTNLFVVSDPIPVQPSLEYELYLLKNGKYLNCQDWTIDLKIIQGNVPKSQFQITLLTMFETVISGTDLPYTGKIPLKGIAVKNTSQAEASDIIVNFYGRI
jgi:hypothetical protein